MRSLKALALVAVAVGLALPALGIAADVYEVGAQGPVDTGLVLTGGGSVTVTATGAVCPFGDIGFCVGPDGDSRPDTTHSSSGGYVLPGAPAWALVGRVGSGPWVVIGSGPTTLAGSGSVVLAANDDQFGDNTGGFSVTLTSTTPAPSPGQDACRPGNGHGDQGGRCGPPGQGDTCVPGTGTGDANHDHCGPPGQAAKESADGKAKGADVPPGKAKKS
jgi:hypothetical protein